MRAVIGLLRGKVAEVSGESILLETGGVGYEVHVPGRLLAHLSARGRESSETVLYIYLHVREEAMQLFGFSSREEKELFLRLLSVSKVGPKVALAVLSGFTPAALWEAIIREDVAAISRVPGLGRKTAERLVLELKEKLPSLPPAGDRGSHPGQAAGRAAREEAREALAGLGYSLQEVTEALTAVSPEMEAEEAVRVALKHLARSRV